MAANDPLTSPIVVTTGTIPSGFLPTGTAGVTSLPVAMIYDPNYVNTDGSTGAWRPLVGKDGVGMGVYVASALPAGTNAIGTVGVTALPALPTGTNTIGNVGVASLPALAGGTNTIGAVTQAGASTYDSDNGTPVTASTTSGTTAITPTAAFRYIAINNTGSSSLQIKIDSGKWITIPASQSWDAHLAGTSFYTQTASGTTTFDWFVY